MPGKSKNSGVLFQEVELIADGRLCWRGEKL